MKTTQFVAQIKRGWQGFSAGMASFAKGVLTRKSASAHPQTRQSKRTHIDGPILKDSKDSLDKWIEAPDGLPPGLPGSAEIRRLAEVLSVQCPADSVHALIQAKDYTSCHELTGFHEAIQALRDLADNVDAVNEEAAQAAQAAGP